ncbi:CAP domain-containing protein [Saccharopolyspora erythraea]|uniref:CAP domain-containing protein n=1 Tax=Saccharopolyspora erythraea TaxID=1836 RepID=UPI001BA7692B|nr:CAP domain-containing protein [Saccharopolyspora erythraea]QUH03359.1 CAP domain-containing protein [Saccharopolyspora erythraea]
MTRSKFQRSVITISAAAALLSSGGALALSPAASADPSAEGRVVELVNQARAGAGCAAVKADSRLADAAQAHSTDMANRSYFDHTSQDGSTFSQRITRAGYPSPAAENIAMGQQTAEQVMDAWMKSPGHKANILNCSLKTIGVGVEPNGWYWTQDFGR